MRAASSTGEKYAEPDALACASVMRLFERAWTRLNYASAFLDEPDFCLKVARPQSSILSVRGEVGTRSRNMN